MKKFLLIALAVVGLSIASAPRSDAGVFFNVGFGGPFWGGYGCGYPAAYGYYPYGGYYPYLYSPGVRVIVRSRHHHHHLYHARPLIYSGPYWR